MILVKVRDLKPGDRITNKATGNTYGRVAWIAPAGLGDGIDVVTRFEDGRYAGTLYGEWEEYEYEVSR